MYLLTIVAKSSGSYAILPANGALTDVNTHYGLFNSYNSEL